MKRTVSQFDTRSFAPNRSGATLTEVLMSLLIFSVGIVSVFTLFPVSLLSSIQATKLTNSKILADNVVEQIRTNPELLRPPGGAAGDPWTGEWQPNQSYAVNDLVWPRLEVGHLFPVPNIAFRCSAAGTSGGLEPKWKTTGTVNDGSAVTWTPITTNANYFVDPLGRFRDGTAATDLRPTFGYDGNGANLWGSGLPRTDADRSNFIDAAPVFTQPDSWTVVLDAVPQNINSTTITFPAGTDLAQITASTHRVIVQSTDGKRSVSRNIQNINSSNRQIVIDNTGNLDLPGNLDSPGEVGRVVVESFQPRYSYLVSVRRTDFFADPKVTAAIIFNRSFNPEDEEVYRANFGNDTDYDDVAEVATATAPSVTGTDQVKVDWSDKDRPPLIREGNYVLDARNAIWYRIIDINRNDSLQNAVLTLDRSVEVTTVDTGTASDVGRAILLPGIVSLIEL